MDFFQILLKWSIFFFFKKAFITIRLQHSSAFLEKYSAQETIWELFTLSGQPTPIYTENLWMLHIHDPLGSLC